MDKLTQLEQALQGLSSTYQQDRASQAEQTAMKQLDNTIADLHNKHGKFDDEMVLVRIARGMEPEAAVQDYKNWYKNEVGTQQRPTPPRLFGNGGHPGGQSDLTKMTKDQRIAFIRDSIAQSE